MDEAGEDLFRSQPRKVGAGFTKAEAAHCDGADAEVAANEIVEAEAAGEQVAPGFGGVEGLMIFANEVFDRLGFDERDIAGSRVGRKGAAAEGVAISYQASAGEGANLRHRVREYARRGGDVDGEEKTGGHGQAAMIH